MARKILRPAKKLNFLIRDRDLLQQKREAVAEAAFELFLKEGFHRTTTRDIARRAGVSAGAPFTYFKDKEDILFHIVSQEQDRAGEQESIEEYIAFLQPLVLAMLETSAGVEMAKKGRRPAALEGRVPREEVTTK